MIDIDEMMNLLFSEEIMLKQIVLCCAVGLAAARTVRFKRTDEVNMEQVHNILFCHGSP